MYYLFLLQAPALAGSSIQPCVPTEAKKETEEILNAILPPKEWEEDGQIWTQKVLQCLFTLSPDSDLEVAII